MTTDNHTAQCNRATAKWALHRGQRSNNAWKIICACPCHPKARKPEWDEGTPREEQSSKDAKIIAEYEDKLVSGQVFSTAWVAAQTNATMANVYRPPLGSRKFADYVKAMGELASRGPVFAHFVSEMGFAVNLYGDEMQMEASVWQRAASALKAGFDDVIGRTGPEPMRESDAKRPYTLREILVIQSWLQKAIGSRVGWVTQALIDREQVGQVAS